ncbi:MAG: DEAD/DEAH box helicase, partial [Planctomyces sp.]
KQGSGGLGNEQRLQVLALLLRLRQLACHVKLVDGSWSQGSSKLQLLREKLLELKERGHRALVFSQFTSHLELIRRECEDAGVTYQYLDGSTPAGRRQELVESFQGGVGDVFLISLKAGGTGLNLTAADYVIHMDPWWNPAVEDQATDRAHRMGQERAVVVYRLIAKETVEEQILSLHEEKRDLVDGVLSGTDAASRLSTQDLAKLIRSGGE